MPYEELKVLHVYVGKSFWEFRYSGFMKTGPNVFILNYHSSEICACNAFIGRNTTPRLRFGHQEVVCGNSPIIVLMMENCDEFRSETG